MKSTMLFLAVALTLAAQSTPKQSAAEAEILQFEQKSAVASCLLHVQTQSARGLADEYFHESDVLFKRGGEWKVVHLNYAPAPKKKI
jgi:hypothetical protein